MPTGKPGDVLSALRAPKRRAVKERSIAGRLGVVTRNVTPLRADPDPDSEQISQALIGQSVVIEGGSKDWLFAATWDTYRGWIQSEAVRVLEEGSAAYASSGPVAVIRELFADIHEAPSERARIITKATISAELEIARSTESWVELRMPDGSAGYLRKNNARLVDRDAAATIWLPEPERLVQTAERFVGVPYLWGGTSPFGLDCSGFVQLVFRTHNVTLLRDAHMQAADPRMVAVERRGIRLGDLLFFGKPQITHVALAVDSKRFIHSRGSVGVTWSSLEDADYAKIFRSAKRLRLATLDPGGGAPEE